jgi:CRP-like cAMP-binding protein
MFARPSRTTNLRDDLAKALSAQRVNQALDLYELIERRNPDEPRWPHRKGDLLRRMGRKADAVLAYERCVELYSAKGFVARAAAMAKVILAIDPSKDAVFERVDPEAARRLHRQNRCVGVTTDEPPDTELESPRTQTNRVLADALPLVTDDAAPTSEMRFENAETAEDLGLDFAEVELVRRPPPPEPLVSMRPSAGTLAQLPSMLLFTDVPSDLLETLVRESTLNDVEDGRRFATAGTAADALYLLVEGNAIEQRGTDTQSLLLGEGDVAGVSCLLCNASYSEDVISCGRARVLRIGKPLLDRLVERHPSFEKALLEILGRRLVATLLRTSPVFTVFDESTRTQIARLFEVRRAAAGTKLLEAGNVSDGVYIPLHGRIVVKNQEGTRIGDMELGHALGQESILTRRPLSFTVEAASDALVLRMSAQAFGDLLLRRPDVVQHIGSQTRRQSGRSYSLGVRRRTCSDPGRQRIDAK